MGVRAKHTLAFLYFTMKSFRTTATNYYKKRYKHYYNEAYPGQAIGNLSPPTLLYPSVRDCTER